MPDHSCVFGDGRSGIARISLWAPQVLTLLSDNVITMSDKRPERRKFTRVALSVAAIIKGKDDIAVGRIENMSLNGLYMRLRNEIFIESEELVIVDIYLNDSDNCYSILTVHGRAVRVSDKGVGVQFRPMTVPDQTRLKGLISLMSGDEAAAEDDQLGLQLSL